ncbi:hypothetical protein Tco_0543544, partial [Tanacetum coccineum]
MRSHFFWGRNSDQRKMAWVSWDSVMASYSRGGRLILEVWFEPLVHINCCYIPSYKSSVHSHFCSKKHVGNGASTRFWEDLWLDNQLLSSRFPRLYALENFKNVAISDRWNDVAWFWQWRREVRGGVEQTQLDGLSALLENITLSSERDRWWWSLDPNGIFSVKLTRQWIDNVVLPSAQLSTRWNKLVPRK